MGHTTPRILLKITGESLLSSDKRTTNPSLWESLLEQIQQLKQTYQFGIVVGGGNFFRGGTHGTSLGMRPAVAHSVGMLATLMNGVIIKDMCDRSSIPATVLSALDCPSVGESISQHAIDRAFANHHLVLFVGGTGNPFFTTDTCAVIRGLQIGASEIWKGTKVNGIYNDDPLKNSQAQLIKQIDYASLLQAKLAIMDATAVTLAQTHQQTIRVFDIFQKDALLHAAHDASFGSTITKS